MNCVCAWCGLVLRRELDEGQPTTHSICPACADRIMAEPGPMPLAEDRCARSERWLPIPALAMLKTACWLMLAGLVLTGSACTQAAGDQSGAVFPGQAWESRQPEQVGLDGPKLAAFAKTVGGDGVVIRDGYLVHAWGDPARRADWASAGKPVLSTLLLFAVREGKLQGVDDPVRPWVAKRWRGKDLLDKDRSMTFRHLADMTSGYARAEAPGSHYAYNDYAIKLYGSLLETVFGASLSEAARQRLAPLQLQDGELFGSRGGLGVNTSPRDFARIGWFWLQQGRWRERQLLPADDFTRYCRPDVPADLPRTKTAGKDYLGIGSHGGGSDQSELGPGIYGFNWWFNAKLPGKNEAFMPHLPPDAFQANGHWGKECMLVVPSLRLVAAARGNWGGTSLANARLLMQAVRP